jgi:hypothetical protein
MLGDQSRHDCQMSPVVEAAAIKGSDFIDAIREAALAVSLIANSLKS